MLHKQRSDDSQTKELTVGWKQILRAAKYAHKRGLEDNALYLYHAGLKLADERLVERSAVTDFLISEIWDHNFAA